MQMQGKTEILEHGPRASIIDEFSSPERQNMERSSPKIADAERRKKQKSLMSTEAHKDM